MATGETNFSLEGRKTWKTDRTPPAEGEQTLILRSEGDKTGIQSGVSQKTGLPYIAFVKTKAQVKGSGRDGNPDKWVNLTFMLSASGQRPAIDAQDGFLMFVRSLGERCEGPTFALVKGTHPNPQLADKGPAEWLDAVKVSDYVRQHDKREFKARLRHQRRFNADKNSTKLEDKEAVVDYYIIDSSVAAASPDDAPVEVPDETVADEAATDAPDSTPPEQEGPGANTDGAAAHEGEEEQETSKPVQDEEPAKEEQKPAPAKKPAPKPAAKLASKNGSKKK